MRVGYAKSGRSYLTETRRLIHPSLELLVGASVQSIRASWVCRVEAKLTRDQTAFYSPVTRSFGRGVCSVNQGELGMSSRGEVYSTETKRPSIHPLLELLVGASVQSIRAASDRYMAVYCGRDQLRREVVGAHYFY